ncbi:MAG: ribose 5-phosphate isomerase A [Chloroflexi bacterium]|nr:MAG: ribose 5-phosphate isomerase A [Chloroflexota bacterium]
MTSVNDLKRQAAEKAVDFVESGMVLGLGTGSTASYAVQKIGELLQAGKLRGIVGVPTSEATAALARQYGIPLSSLADHPVIDLAIDGADEIDPHLDLIKGLGGALLREKMIELEARRFIVVADAGKLVDRLGTRSPVPVEVTRFGWRHQARWLESLGCIPNLRGGESDPFITDNGNYILDCTFPNGIDNPAELDTILHNRTGVVEHGLFLGMATDAVVAGPDGLRLLRR